MFKNILDCFSKKKENKQENEKENEKELKNVDLYELNDKEFIDLYNNYKKQLNELNDLKANFKQNPKYSVSEIINKINKKFEPIMFIIKEQGFGFLEVPIQISGKGNCLFCVNERTVFVCENLRCSCYHDKYEDKIEMGYYFWTNIYNNIDNYIEQLKKRLDLYFKKLMEENEKDITQLSEYLEKTKDN